MNLLLMANNGLPRNGLVALYDPYRDTAGRNILPVEPASLTDTTDSNVTWNNGVEFGDNSVVRYALVLNSSSFLPSTQYGFAVNVQMTDGGVPVPGAHNNATKDFYIAIGGNQVSTYAITHVSDTTYRIAVIGLSPASPNAGAGIYKTTSQSARGFTITGMWQLNLLSLYPYSAPAGLPTALNDYSQHGNLAQLGSTAGADTNDPRFSGTGLVFGTDDCAVKSAITLVQPLTMIVAAKTPHSAAWSHLITSNDGTNRINMYLDRNVVLKAYAGADLSFGVVNLDTNYIFSLTANNKNSALRLNTNKVTGDGGSKYMSGIMIGNRVELCEPWLSNIYLVAVYNRALSDAEYLRAYNSIKRLMSQRGVTI